MTDQPVEVNTTLDQACAMWLPQWPDTITKQDKQYPTLAYKKSKKEKHLIFEQLYNLIVCNTYYSTSLLSKWITTALTYLTTVNDTPPLQLQPTTSN